MDNIYERNDYELKPGRFRVRGDVVDVMPAYMEHGLRVEFFGDTVEAISEFDPLTGEVIREPREVRPVPGEPVREEPGVARPGHRVDQGRARGAGGLVRGPRASTWRRSGSR